jgi:hypothetical protein
MEKLERKAAWGFKIYSSLGLLFELSAFLCQLPLVLGILAILNGGWNVEPLLELMAVSFGIFLLFEYAATQVEKKVVLHSSFKEKLKDSFYMFLLMFASFGGLLILNRYFGLFPTELSSNVMLEILKTVVQADGFLIGLSGVIYAQMFWVINNQQNSFQMDIVQRPFKSDETNATDIREVYVTRLDKKWRDMTLKMSGTVGLLLISVALSLSAMAGLDTLTNSKVQTFPVVIPMLLMFLGVIFLVISIATLRTSLEKPR